MVKYINVEVLRLEELFSPLFRFHLPWFQRAYAWNEDHAAQLVADVLRAMAGPRKRYFLGHIMLAKADGRPKSAIIDGQQRAITLTILFALLRDLMGGTPEGARLQAAIFETGDATGAGSHYRLTPQPNVTEFLERCVQVSGSTQKDPPNGIEVSESARHILANRDHMRAMLEEKVRTPQDRSALIQFLLDNCFVIVESVEDEEEAWAMLISEEQTGLPHHSSERAKITLISAMPNHEQEEAGTLWESAQAEVGSDDLHKLLSQIRTLLLRRRSAKPVEKDLSEGFRLDRTGIPFLKQELVPRAKLLKTIKERDIGQGAARSEIKQALDTLSWLDRQLWMAPALHWLAERGPAHRETPLFFRWLDRLAWLLKMSGTDPTAVERRFIRVVNDIDRFRSVSQMNELAIEPKLLNSALTNLRSRTFYDKHYAGLVLRRLCLNAGADPGPVDGDHMTLEHVLPLRPKSGSIWLRVFRDQKTVSDYANRLGNLVCLLFADNQAAGSSDYSFKRPIFAKSGCIISSKFAATYDAWTPERILARTESLIQDLFRKWELPIR